MLNPKCRETERIYPAKQGYYAEIQTDISHASATFSPHQLGAIATEKRSATILPHQLGTTANLKNRHP